MGPSRGKLTKQRESVETDPNKNLVCDMVARISAEGKDGWVAS